MTKWASGWRLWTLIALTITATLVVVWTAGGMKDNGINDPIDIPCSLGIGHC